jgi:hypothetical protein
VTDAAARDATLTELASEILGPETSELYSARQLRDFARRAQRSLDQHDQLVIHENGRGIKADDGRLARGGYRPPAIHSRTQSGA